MIAGVEKITLDWSCAGLTLSDPNPSSLYVAHETVNFRVAEVVRAKALAHNPAG